MLSFMREQEPEDSLQQKAPATGDKGARVQEQEYLTVAANAKKARKSTMLLAVLFGMGLLCLFFMIKKSTPKTATAAAADTEQTQIEQAIARLTGVKSEMFNRMDEIVRKFYEFSDVQQVNVTELAKNPFRHEIFLSDLKKISDIEEGNSDIDVELMRKQQLRQQASNMRLMSIMQSDQGKCCMIDDKILYEGQSIEGFTVNHISDSFVKLRCEGVETILKLSQ
jgi:hypothetical protein